MSEFVIAESRIPREVGAEGWSDFVAMTDLRNEIEAAIVGTDELGFSAESLLPSWHDPVDKKRVFVARVDGQIVGRVVYEFSDADTVAWLTVEVLERHTRQGIGSALYAYAYEIAVAEGKTVFQGDGYSRPDDPGPRIPSPSGFGSVAASSPSSRFAVARGYELQMVLRFSRLALPVDTALLARHRVEAEAKVGADYRVVRWQGRTPELWLGDLAELHGRMFTDAPHGDLDLGVEVWDEARQRQQDDRDAASPDALLMTAIEHVPSSRLVAMSEMLVPPDLTRPVHQRDTLVLAEHRGHRLGMLMKVDNLEQLQKFHPGHPSVTTTNAEENAFMLMVNEAVGFVPIAYSGVWKQKPADI